MICWALNMRNLDRIVDITTDAFQHDPFNTWVFETRANMHRLFEREARSVYGKHGQVDLIENDAAMMWMPKGQSHDMPLMTGLGFVASLCVRGQFGALQRAFSTADGFAKAFPEEPVTYLFTIAVRPEAQGKGRGGQLMRRFVDACDADGSAGWLESTNPGNRGFYQSFGFHVREVLHVTNDAPPVDLMYREARL